jgi:hypothetical protein
MESTVLHEGHGVPDRDQVLLGRASAPRWVRSRRSNWRWSSAYALCPAQRIAWKGRQEIADKELT